MSVGPSSTETIQDNDLDKLKSSDWSDEVEQYKCNVSWFRSHQVLLIPKISI